MNRRIRQYLGIIAAVVVYYVVHEGAHLLTALYYGVFKNIQFMGIIGIQIDVYNTRMTDTQLGVLCIMGPVATFIAGYLLVFFTQSICNLKSDDVRTIGWYTTLILLLLDPIYLVVLQHFVGGGDMNGISLLMPEMYATLVWLLVGIVNLYTLIKYVYPKYSLSFNKKNSER